MKRKITFLIVTALVAGGGFFAFQTYDSSRDGTSIPGGIAMARPAIAQEVSFLDDEAGIAAYTKIGTTIDLDDAALAFRVIERRTSEWVVGTVAIAGETEEVDPHVFVHQSGWIVAYYLRETPVSTALHWVEFDLGTTHLQQALGDVASSAGAPVATLGFYNFRFPEATEWLIIIDSDSFDLTIPIEFFVYERSYAFKVQDSSCGSSSTGTLSIDGSVIDDLRLCGQSARVYGGLSFGQLVPGTVHQVEATGSNTSKVALSLLFKEG